jgi:hypothetical protein
MPLTVRQIKPTTGLRGKTRRGGSETDASGLGIEDFILTIAGR